MLYTRIGPYFQSPTIQVLESSDIIPIFLINKESEAVEEQIAEFCDADRLHIDVLPQRDTKSP